MNKPPKVERAEPEFLGGRGGHCYSQREVAKVLGVTHQRVEQIERNALRKVRAFLESKGTLP